MNWFLGILFCLICIFLYNNFTRKKRLKKFKKHLLNNWGKPKKDTYFNFFAIGRYFDNNNHKKKAFHIISEKGKLDLDIDEVFKFIDRTCSKIGQQYLYYKLRTIGSLNDLMKFSALTKIFEVNKQLSIECQLLLSKLNTNETYYFEELINGKQIEKPKNIWFVYTLTILAIVSLILTFIYPVSSILLILIFAVNLFFHYKNKGNISYYLDGVTQLSKCLKVSQKLAKFPEIASHYNNFLFLTKVSSIQLKTEFIGFDKLAKNEYTFIFWFPIELLKILFNLEYLIFFSFIDAINKQKESIEKMYFFIGEIDVAISTASLKFGSHLICKPQFTATNEIHTENIYHPLIKNCIPNDLNLSNSSMLLTGSNMSGKTTFIRTIAINSILAQTLNICFAKQYSAPFLQVHTSIRISDDLLDDTSYYLKEVLIIKELIDASQGENPCLFVLDEIFKGTNTIERISGGKAILSFLNKENNIVFVSTHDIELADLLKKDNYELFHFSEQINNNKLFFDHKLKNGKLKTRNAIKILELYNYPSGIISDARKIENEIF